MKYIGQQMTYKNIIDGASQIVIPGEHYNVNVTFEGAQAVINGVPVLDPGGTIWVEFENGVRVPYAPNVLSNFWENND